MYKRRRGFNNRQIGQQKNVGNREILMMENCYVDLIWDEWKGKISYEKECKEKRGKKRRGEENRRDLAAVS